MVINNKLLKPDKELRRKQINNKWYENNKNYHKEHYKKNEENIRIRNRYYYYKKTNNLKKFQEKFPNDVIILTQRGITFD